MRLSSGPGSPFPGRTAGTHSLSGKILCPSTVLTACLQQSLPLLPTSTQSFSTLQCQEGQQVEMGTGQMQSEVCLV